MIFAGYFSVNFFIKNKLRLEKINGRNDPITKEGTTIDAVFARNIEKIALKHFVSNLDISLLESDNEQM